MGNLFIMAVIAIALLLWLAYDKEKPTPPSEKSEKDGNLAKVSRLVSTGEDVNKRNKSGYTPLHNAESPDAVNALVKAGANINAISLPDYDTPLHLAALYGKTEIANALISLGANLEAVDSSGHTALLIAAGANDRRGCSEIANMLIAAGAKVNAKGDLQNTALHWAVKAGLNEVVKALISAGANVNARNFFGETALARAKNKDIINILRQAGAFPAPVAAMEKLSPMSASNYHRTNDGIFVRSGGEKAIADYLYKNNVRYEYEPLSPSKEKKERILPDFYLPDGDVYIEYWGLEGESGYEERKSRKLEIYKKHNLNLIELANRDVGNLDNVLPRLLSEYGIQISANRNR